MEIHSYPVGQELLERLEGFLHVVTLEPLTGLFHVKKNSIKLNSNQSQNLMGKAAEGPCLTKVCLAGKYCSGGSAGSKQLHNYLLQMLSHSNIIPCIISVVTMHLLRTASAIQNWKLPQGYVPSLGGCKFICNEKSFICVKFFLKKNLEIAQAMHL